MFEKILFNKLKIYMTESYNDIFFNHAIQENEDSDFEKEVISHISNQVKFDYKDYTNYNNFKEFIEIQNNSENNKILKTQLIIPPSLETNPHKKINSDMEFDNLQTNFSVKSFDLSVNPNLKKKFAVIKN